MLGHVLCAAPGNAVFVMKGFESHSDLLSMSCLQLAAQCDGGAEGDGDGSEYGGGSGSVGGGGGGGGGGVPFFQRVQLPPLQLRIDYRPRRVDVGALAVGSCATRCSTACLPAYVPAREV
jgi:hypothetical protein